MMLNNQLICVNARITYYHLTGVQRYYLEVLNPVKDSLNKFIFEVKPPFWLSETVLGHTWEQLILPYYTKRKLLFSPSNTGPISVRNQVVTIHDVVALDHPEWLNPRFAAWYQFLLPRLAKRVKKIITISDFSKERILHHINIPENKIAVIPNGVSENFIPCNKCDIVEAKKILNIPEGEYILYLGSLEPRKNLQRVVMAWNKIQDNLPKDVHLVIAGAKGRKQVFQAIDIPESIQNVIFLGHVPDQYLPALYSGALYFIYVSIYEGFGLPVLEAMACGTPVLTSNTTSIPEVVGNAAILVDPLSVNAISEAMLALQESESFREQLKVRSLKRAESYSWRETSRQTWELLLKEATN